MKKNIDTFHIDIFREDIKQQYSYKSEDTFQQLCYDLLNVKFPTMRLIPFPAKGKDGSIDHYGWTDNNASIIVECKKNDTQDLAIAALKALSTKLQTSLSGKNATNNLYQPWFNHTFEHYFYCTSATFSAPKDLVEFKKAIKEMFIKLSAINGLGHLKNISIDLFTWNELKEIIKKDAFCEHKWIDHKIVGATFFDENLNEQSDYRRNLFSSKLPFISRTAYKQKFRNEEIETEDEIFSQLFSSNTYKGLLIHGQGGVGKTRLMYELGIEAKKHAWIVLKITKSLNDLQDLDLRPNEKYCLLFDYIEENKYFTQDIVDILNEYFSRTAIKIIATSRSSYLLSNDVPKDFLDIDISRNIGYVQFVTNEILNSFGFNLEINNIKPSFAVFLKEDFKNNLDISNNFKDYLKKRLCKTTFNDQFANINNQVFSILASLPFQKCLDTSLDKELNLLRKDGWLTEQNGEYSSEHDTIIDELIELYLAQAKFDNSEKQHEIKTLIDTSLNRYSTFRTFDRISDWILNEKKITDYDFFSSIIKSFDNIDIDTMNLISKTALINDKNRFSIYVEKFDQYRDYINSFVFVYPLSSVIHKSSKDSIIDDNITYILDKWIDANLATIANNKQSYRIMASVFKAFGLEHKMLAFYQPWLNKFPLEIETEFVLKAWLDAKGDADTVRSYIVPWLNKFPLEIETQYVLKSWLDAKGESELIRPYIVPWLDKFPLEIETEFVLKAWLDAKENIETVRPYIVPWLDKFPLEIETEFVLQAWLDAKGDTDTVRPYIVPWIEKFLLEIDTSFILKSWLDAKGDIELVRPYIVPWLDKFPLEMETSFILKSWLNTKGDTDTVHPCIVPWLDKFPLEMETHFVLKSWLDAKGDTDTVRPYIVPWLDKFPLEMETSFILKSWLDAKGESELIRPYIVPWLDKFPLEYISFVLQSWLYAKGESELIRPYIVPWLDKFSLEIETEFVLQAWLDAKGDTDAVRPYIVPWLDKFPLEIETYFVLKSWLDAKGDIELVRPYIVPWLDKFPLEIETEFILQAWLDAKGDTDTIRPYIVPWLEKFLLEMDTSFILKSWLNSKGELSERFLELLYQWIQCNEQNCYIDFILKRVFRIPKKYLLIPIPNDVKKIALLWCKKNIASIETLFMLSYLAPITWTRDVYLYLARIILKQYIEHNLISSNEILAFETVMYFAYKNKNFTEVGDIELLRKWTCSEYSFTCRGAYYIEKDTNYYEKLIELSQGAENHNVVNKLNIFFNIVNKQSKSLHSIFT